jgi:hypothetical protein
MKVVKSKDRLGYCQKHCLHIQESTSCLGSVVAEKLDVHVL